jgi:hypothetical protein
MNRLKFGFWKLLGILTSITSPAFADAGVWSTSSQFQQINVFCQRVYTCGPSQDILRGADTKLVVTSPKLVSGVCSAGAGPADSCNTCLTNPPTVNCEWHLEKK